MKQRLRYQIALASLIEQLPDPKNRMTLSKEFFDKMGLPRPEIYYQIGDYERKALRHAQDLHNYLFNAWGVSGIKHSPSYHTSAHIMGTFRMGKNPKDSVVNPELRCHDHSNLFLLGSGVFPSGGAANPTLTLAALALRSADLIVRECNKS